ncbi:uncharacterized protein LOC115449089 [Manduca sexta]|uniref:RING-CH-type domain-containing protein n=1 Tax=Manduca sexta TaxID=7130 RepID=A0A921ZK05_MANSE|nr:uncharacterized protein LOC115449089 [Manduca sexta]KAG6458843.1 hypothetical protein O3G_MSEX011082 [Manduca sexta]
MPNTRRRRFSVQNDIARRDSTKIQNISQSSHPDLNEEIKVMTNNLVAMRPAKVKNKTHPSSSKNSSSLEIVAECESKTSMLTIKKRSSVTVDKDVSASSSSIDLIKEAKKDEPISQSNEAINTDVDELKNVGYTHRDRTVRRDKPRQHRVKVRSPKRRVAIFETKTDNDRRTIGTAPIDWSQVDVVPELLPVESTEDEDRPSDHSTDDMCRICHSGDALSQELGRLISACSCRGTVGRVHVKCLERWLTESGKSRCELCGTRYATKRVHRYGVPRALLMWILSQNAKQLMVDSLGIMLMSPLAVLAAWLSGRTLAGLMTQDNHVAPWPLASTFVLACMTLVCYYCWIVSAATRHALGWWIWYRSQYEMRLQFQESEE